MRRVKFIKPYKSYTAGQTLEVANNDAHSLIDQGVAELANVSSPARAETFERSTSAERQPEAEGKKVNLRRRGHYFTK